MRNASRAFKNMRNAFSRCDLPYSILPPTGVDYSGVIAGRVRSPEMKNFYTEKSKEYFKKMDFLTI